MLDVPDKVTEFWIEIALDVLAIEIGLDVLGTWDI